MRLKARGLGIPDSGCSSAQSFWCFLQAFLGGGWSWLLNGSSSRGAGEYERVDVLRKGADNLPSAEDYRDTRRLLSSSLGAVVSRAVRGIRQL